MEKETLKTTRQMMELNASAYNRHLSLESLKSKTLIELLQNTHPTNRIDFVKQLHHEGKMSEKQLKDFIDGEMEKEKQWKNQNQWSRKK